jgi:dTDP-4-dehydrorhamnose 3,5-epimerase
MDGVTLTPLRRIAVPRGDVFHAIKAGDPGYAGFGEAYFSTIEFGAIKGWKRHNRMTMNLVVPAGSVEFVIANDRVRDAPEFQAVTLSPASDESYVRLTVPPGHWVAFRGRAEGLNLVLNFASILHDPQEADNRPIDAFNWSWDA